MCVGCVKGRDREWDGFYGCVCRLCESVREAQGGSMSRLCERKRERG